MRLLLALLALLAFPAAAAAQVGDAASALKSDPVYVDQSAELAGQVDAGALRERIGSDPIFVAVLPASATQDSAGRTLIALRQDVGRKGTYALAVGDEFRTLSDSFDAAAPGDAARAAHPDDLQQALLAFIDRAKREGVDSGSGGSAAGAIIAAVVLLAVLIGGAVLLVSRRRARAQDGRSEARRPDVDEDFVRLGDLIRAIELDITLSPDEAAKADYQRGVEAYDRANALYKQGDEAGADRALDDGLHAVGAARERLAGRRPAPPV